MMLQIPSLLDAASLAAFQKVGARRELFVDGVGSAGWYASQQKSNLQAGNHPLVAGLLAKVEKVLLENLVVQAAARPSRLVKVMLSRYETGMYYGDHVDDAFINGERADISFTLFLSPLDSYEGGALVLDEPAGERVVKLEAGSLFIYPSTALHRVEEVTAGSRIAVVGWMTSRIRDALQRETLFDLDRAIFGWRQAHGDHGQPLALLLKTRSNLLRLWSER